MLITSLLEVAGVAHLPKAKRLIELHFVVEGFKEAQSEFSSVVGEEQARLTITQFRDLVNRNQVQGNERNIDFWRKQGWGAFYRFVSTKSQEKSKTQEKRSKIEGRSITIHEDPNWLVVVPLDKDASCYYGKHTDWCTTKPHAFQFERYFYDNEIVLIYFLQLDTGNKWAIAAHPKTDKIEMFDKHDKSINESTFKQQTGFDPSEYRNKVMGSDNTSKAIAYSRSIYKEVVDRINAKMPFDEVDDQLERDLRYIKNPYYIVDYCRRVKGRWPEVERMLSRDASHAFSYAKHVIKGRWHEVEDVIAKDTTYAALYAKDVIKGRWMDAEDTIITDISDAVLYANDVIKARWPALEVQGIKMLRKLAERAVSSDFEDDWDNVELAVEELSSYRDKRMSGEWPELDPYIQLFNQHSQ